MPGGLTFLPSPFSFSLKLHSSQHQLPSRELFSSLPLNSLSPQVLQTSPGMEENGLFKRTLSPTPKSGSPTKKLKHLPNSADTRVALEATSVFLLPFSFSNFLTNGKRSYKTTALPMQLFKPPRHSCFKFLLTKSLEEKGERATIWSSERGLQLIRADSVWTQGTPQQDPKNQDFDPSAQHGAGEFPFEVLNKQLCSENQQPFKLLVHKLPSTLFSPITHPHSPLRPHSEGTFIAQSAKRWSQKLVPAAVSRVPLIISLFYPSESNSNPRECGTG